MALTDKQRRFVDAKAKGASNRDAALAADCAASSAAAAGSRWAKDPKILAAIEERKAELNVKAPARKSKEKPADPGTGEKPEADGEYLDCLPTTDDPLVWLLALMNEPTAKVFDRRNAAQTAVPYVHGKRGEQGKKEAKQEAAKEVAKGRYGQGKPPLSVVKV